jgi:hypothetical protein
MVMPGLLGVQVAPGPHRLTFRYEPFGGYLPLFVLGALALLGVWWLNDATAGQLSGDGGDQERAAG